MKKQIEQVLEFHKKFNIPFSEKLQSIELTSAVLRINLIEEEAKEVEDALYHEGAEEVAKELCDLLYVTYGTIITFGLQDKIEECFDEVHKNNMSKVDETGKPKYRNDGKLIKPENYKPVNLKNIIYGNLETN